MTIIKVEEKPYIQLEVQNQNPKKELEHSIKFAWIYAKDGDVDYTRQCLKEANEFSNKIGQIFDEKLKNDIMKIALKKGVKRQLEYAKLYANESDLRDSCLNSAEDYSREILNYQRSVREIISGIGGRIVYRLKYGRASDEELQERFDKEGRVYDNQVIKNQKIMLKKVEGLKKKLIERKPHKLGLFEIFRRKSKEDENQVEKTLVNKDVSSTQLNIQNIYSNYIGISTPSQELDSMMNFAWENEVNKLLKETASYSRRGFVHEAEESLNSAISHAKEGKIPILEKRLVNIRQSIYKNGTNAALRKANKYAKKGMLVKAKTKLDEAHKYASAIKNSIPIQEIDNIMKTAYTNGMPKMLDRSMRMAEKGKVNIVKNALDITQYCADHIGVDFSKERKNEILKIAYTKEVDRLLNEAEVKANQGMFESVKSKLKIAEFDAAQVGRSILVKEENSLLRTAVKKGVERELRKAEMSERIDNRPLTKRHLKKAEKFADEILNYQRSVREIISGIGGRIVYRLKYGRASDEELQERFDKEGRVYDNQVIKNQKKLKKQIEKTKKKLYF